MHITAIRQVYGVPAFDSCETTILKSVFYQVQYISKVWITYTKNLYIRLNPSTAVHSPIYASFHKLLLLTQGEKLETICPSAGSEGLLGGCNNL